MKPTLIAVFAHPDDEAFGPSGTLALLAKKYRVILLCATKGEKGEDRRKDTTNQTLGDKQKNNTSLGEIRAEELQKSARVLEIKDVYFLGFMDGTLCNNTYHRLVDKIALYVNKYKPSVLLTYEQRGISGHLDHVAVSFATSFVYEKYSFVKKIMYYCISARQRKMVKDYFIYFPDGYRQSEVQEIVNVSSVWNTKLKAVYAHLSQMKDIRKHISPMLQKLPKEEWFVIKTKK